ncbi:MAG: acyloxyacyl hydrolase [Lewinellaceae bacterium]|nr:acyloxyacyl hydrolase [Lewinellaceae bacterium]
MQQASGATPPTDHQTGGLLWGRNLAFVSKRPGDAIGTPGNATRIRRIGGIFTSATAFTATDTDYCPICPYRLSGRDGSRLFRLGTGLRGWPTRLIILKPRPKRHRIMLEQHHPSRLGGEVRLSNHFRLNAGAALSHFSNGGAAPPNYGINLFSGYTGLVWSPHPIRELDFCRPERKTARQNVSAAPCSPA